MRAEPELGTASALLFILTFGRLQYEWAACAAEALSAYWRLDAEQL